MDVAKGGSWHFGFNMAGDIAEELVRGRGGHLQAEDAPDEVLAALGPFLSAAPSRPS